MKITSIDLFDFAKCLNYEDCAPICIRIKLDMAETPIFNEVLVEPKFSKEFNELEAMLELTPDDEQDPRLATALALMGWIGAAIAIVVLTVFFGGIAVQAFQKK